MTRFCGCCGPVTEESVHQALFGYARGHRMLASSLVLPTEAAHVLRAATDTAVERDGSRYLTVLPMPELRAQAFVRTWRGEDWLRPGSVWSHVLFVDFLVLAKIRNVGALTALFDRPQLEEGAAEPDLRQYQHPFAAPSSLFKEADSRDVDRALAERIISAIYGTGERVVVGVDNAAAAEATLGAIYEQQWPRLRRQFAFRTRLRPSDSSTTYDLDVVERTRPESLPVTEDAAWVAPLVYDVLVGKRSDLRDFLRLFGAGAVKGRRDMPALVTVHTSLMRDTPDEAVRVLCRAFPESRQMRGLKAALLGPLGRRRAWNPPQWPESDAERLSLLFEAVPSAVDYDELEVGARIAGAIETSPRIIADALHNLDLERLPASQVQLIVGAVVGAANDDVASAIAAEQPDLGVLLVAQRPVLLTRPDIWQRLDSELLVDVYARASPEEQSASLRALLDAAAEEALISLCSAEPRRWWELLSIVDSFARDMTRVEADGRVVRSILGRVGAAAIGAPPSVPETDEHLIALLVSADLAIGVWRHAPSRAWVDLWTRVGGKGLTPALRDRLATVALLAATSSGGRSLRIEAWRATFPHLHKALADSGFDEEAWRSLAAALPAAPDWDRCLRLRRGAIGEVRRDRWPADDANRLLAASGAYRNDMISELRVAPGRKKSKHWLRQLIDSVLP
jgi:hypothetical protein